MIDFNEKIINNNVKNIPNNNQVKNNDKEVAKTIDAIKNDDKRGIWTNNNISIQFIENFLTQIYNISKYLSVNEIENIYNSFIFIVAKYMFNIEEININNQYNLTINNVDYNISIKQIYDMCIERYENYQTQILNTNAYQNSIIKNQEIININMDFMDFILKYILLFFNIIELNISNLFKNIMIISKKDNNLMIELFKTILPKFQLIYNNFLKMRL